MPVSLDCARSPVIVRLLTALILTAMLFSGLLPAGCSSAKAPPATPSEEEPPEAWWDLDAQSTREVPVKSWAMLEVDEFNATVAAAVDSGETWPEDPIEVVEQFIWGRIGAYYTRLEKQDNRVEGADSTVITLIRDRYADDSVRGDWHRIALNRLQDGTWRLLEARRAFRCYRGHQQDSYGERLCL